MRFGHFDDRAKEYVVDRPDTPRAWTNYLGDTRYGAVVTNHGGGYSFYHSAAGGRLLRYRTNIVPDGMPGRLFYLRDQETGKYWSATWQPVGDVEGFEGYECRHGTAYTTIQTQTDGIEAQTTYFVPLGQRFEVWRLRLTNRSGRARKIGLATYCEFTADWNLSQDLINVQYTAYISRAAWADGPRPGDNPILQVSINEHLPGDDDDFNCGGSRHEWISLLGAPMSGYDTQRESFLGYWGTYKDPRAVVEGKWKNSVAYGDTPCGGMGADFELQPGETREVSVFLGIGKPETHGRQAISEYGSPDKVEAELAKLKAHWHGRLDALEVSTPSEPFDHMVNTWGIYNSLITFAWSRAASLVYNGERDGLGYRDTVQDILGVAAAIPEEAQERLELMLTGQTACGGAMPLIRPTSHRPGHEPTPDEFRSDDALWLFNTVPALVNETGDLSFFRKILPYADHGEATVFGHLRRALEFNLERVGANSLPCGLAADWNDCLNLGYNGESIFVTFQVRFGLNVYAEIADRLGESAEAEWARGQVPELDKHIQKSCWDGGWFRWAIAEDGTVFGTKDYPEGQVYVNTQCWAVISGAATPDQATRCMDVAADRLATEYGMILCDPPFIKTPRQVMAAVLFNPGTKENGSIFSHPQSWAVIAECVLGRGDKAMEYHLAYLPAAQNDKAEIREIEPYVHCQSTHGKHSPRFGVSRLPWLSGTAAWTYHSATQHILGLQPQVDGFRIDPCIPAAWDGFEAKRRFRGKTLQITVKNPNHVCKGIASLTVDGTKVEGNIAPIGLLKDGSRIDVVMG